MRQLIYVSAAVEPFTSDQLVDLLRRARFKNRTLDVTGLLLYHQGSFLQVLEGPDHAVRDLARTIAADPRHARFKPLFDRSVAARSFDGWAMGFAEAEGENVRHLAGKLDYLTGVNAASGLEDENLVRWVLDLFRAGRMRQAVQTDDRPAAAAAGR